jgi:dCMP deaminase
VIVTPDNRIIGTGWNGMPSCKNLRPNQDNDSVFPWGKDSPNALENKYMYVIHAEPNAIAHAAESVRGCIMYLTWFPCSECAKSIVQSGISKLVYLHSHTTDRYRESMEAAKIMFAACGVICEKYETISENNNDIVLRFV